MIARFSIVMLLLCHTAIAGDVLDLQRVRSTDDLARFIRSMETNNTALSVLLKGLDSTNSMKVAPDTTAIPVREIYGVIVEERFGDALGAGFYERGKKYDVRAICAFRDKRGEIWRYHITIFEDRQYRLMRDLLKRKINRAA